VVTVFDGDVVRQYLSKGLGFSKEDRDTHVLRVGFVSHLITKHGGIAITAAISPYRAIRAENRKLIGHYIEVYCECPIEECEKRDVKGLYGKARKALADGKPMHFTGVDDPYEEPLEPEILVNTAKGTIRDSTEQVLRGIQELGYLDDTVHLPADYDSHHEYVPEELISRAEAALRKAGRVHTDVLLKDLHVGFATAAHLIDRLGETGVVTLQGPGEGGA
jgi:adenylyl-sulfate kinase